MAEDSEYFVYVSLVDDTRPTEQAADDLAAQINTLLRQLPDYSPKMFASVGIRES